jgi:hypothetical protein
MSKSSGTGASGTEQSGRVRTGGGGAVVPSSGTRFSNYDDVLNLPKVTFDNDSLKVLKNLKKDFNLKDISNEEVVAMAGALNNSEIRVTNIGNDSYRISISNDYLDGTQERTISRDYNGNLIIDNNYFFLKRDYYMNDSGEEVFDILPEYKNKGIATKSLARQVFYAAKNGVKRIETVAAKSDTMNGYYVWPKHGFEGNIPTDLVEKIRKRFKDPNMKTMQDIFDKPGGNSYWKTNGKEIYLEFDLTPGSRSLQRLGKVKNVLLSKFGRIW